MPGQRQETADDRHTDKERCMKKRMPWIAAALTVAGLGMAAGVWRLVAGKPAGGKAGSTSAFVSSAQAAERPASGDTEPPVDGRRGIAAAEKAAGAGRYLFVFFHNADDEQTRRMRQVFDGAAARAAARADSIVVNVTDPSEKETVEQFGVAAAPMPLVLVLAPNGATTGGFPQTFTEQQLVDGIVSSGMAKCLKALQDRKLVFLCVQNDRTTLNRGAMRGVRAFAADARFSQATEIVLVDPADPEEARLLAQLKIDPGMRDAITVFLAPPGSAIARFQGATDKETLVTTLMAATSSSGCGSGSSAGCGPTGCAPPQ
jgi:hypothetical protein